MDASHSRQSTQARSSPNFFRFEFEDPDDEGLPEKYTTTRHPTLNMDQSITARQLPTSGHKVHLRHEPPPEDEWSQILFLHPNISLVVVNLIEGLNNNFSYGSVKLLMIIFDLQIVYRLSQARPSKDSHLAQIPQTALLPATLVTRCAEKISSSHIRHHIAPDCFLEREIQLRALVSTLSLLWLLSKAGGNKRPALTGDAKSTIRDNVIGLAASLHRSGGTATEIGDCEFLLEYSFSLLDYLPNDEPIAEAVASRVVNFLFAAGVAYQYNGAETLKHLKRTFMAVETKPDAWYAEFDEHHHQVIGLLSFSLYFGHIHPQALHTIIDHITTLQQKLRDCFVNVNESRTLTVLLGSRRTRELQNRTTDAIGAEPAKHPAHLAYGLMYLIGRLVERLVLAVDDVDGNERKIMRELVEFLVVICQTSRFEQLAYKAHEILFNATRLRSLPSLSAIESKVLNSKFSKKSAGHATSEHWSATMEGLKRRKNFIRKYPVNQEVALLHSAREGHEAPAPGPKESKNPRRSEPGSAVSSPTSLISQASDRIRRVARETLLSIFDTDDEGRSSYVRDPDEPSSSNSPPLGIVHSAAMATPIHIHPSKHLTHHRSFSDREARIYAQSPLEGPSSYSSHYSTPRVDSLPSLSERSEHHRPLDHQLHFNSPALSPQSFVPHSPATPHSAAPASMPLTPTESFQSHSSGRSTSHPTYSYTSTGPRNVFEWKEKPLPFVNDYTTQIKLDDVSVKRPLSACLSASCQTVAFLSTKQVSVYTVEYLRSKSNQLKSCRKFVNSNTNEYVACAVNDEYVASITRTQLDVLNHTIKTPVSRYVPFESRERLCCVTISNSSTRSLVAVGLVTSNKCCLVKVYEITPGVNGSFQIAKSTQRVFQFEPLSDSQAEFGDPVGLRFSEDANYLVCSSSRYGRVRTWCLSRSSNTPGFYEHLPNLNTMRGYGIAGVSSTVLFPSSRYILSTTGSPNGPAAYIITRYSKTDASSVRPKLQDLFDSKGPLIAGAVSSQGNALAAMSGRGKVYLSTLEADDPAGYRVVSQKELGTTGDGLNGDLAFTEVVGGFQVLVAACVVPSRFGSGGYGKVFIWTFEQAQG